MTDDPVMRYIDVLKDRVKMLEKERAAAKAQIEKIENVISAYQKLTNLTITTYEPNDD